MDEMVRLGLIGGVLGAVAMVIALLALDLLKKHRFCPDCSMPLPKLRRLKNARQRRCGGWTCHNCGCEVDRSGGRVV